MDNYPNLAMPQANTSVPADNPDDANCTADCEEEADDSGKPAATTSQSSRSKMNAPC